jgi:predicted dehydrogenase
VNRSADKQTLRVGIVGCGSIARAHALSYQNNAHVELVGVVDIDPGRAAAFAAGYGTTAYGSCRELLEHEPDLISVATPPGDHTAVAVELLESGCSVLLEKPPATTLADMDVLADAEKLSSGSVYVVFQHRHGSGARRAHHLLHSGALGTPLVAVCETLWYRPDNYFLPEWRGNWVGEGGGPTLGHGIHQIDLLLHLLGPWETIDGRAARIARSVEFEDVSFAILTFANGAVGTVVTSLLSPRELSRIRVDTTGGTLEVDHVYGYSDADWSWAPAPDATTAARGTLVGAPIGVANFSVGVNPEVLKKAGVSMPNDKTWTWDQLAQVAAQVTGKLGSQGVYGFDGFGTGAAELGAWARQNGEEIWPSEGAGVSQATITSFFGYANKLVAMKATPPAEVQVENATAVLDQSLFATNKAAFHLLFHTQISAFSAASGT